MAWQFPNSNHRWLPDSTLFVTRTGSRAYGTNRPDSDEDFRGVVVPPREYLLGFLNRFEQAVFTQEMDCVLYGLHKFFKLATDCNPSIIELLWTDDSLRVFTNERWRSQVELLMASRDLFLSKKAKHTFAGYAMSQLKRIKLHRRWFLNPPDRVERKDFGLQERPLVSGDRIKAALAAIQKQIDEWEFRELELLDPATRQVVMDAMATTLAEIEVGRDEKFLAAGRVLGMDDNWLDILDRERRYKSAKNERKQYENWLKNRNPARAEMEKKYGYDCYVDDTEFLTKLGWKKYDEITENDELATIFIAPSDKVMEHRAPPLGIEYQPYIDRFEGSYTGDLYSFSGSHLDLLVTPNHRMLIRQKERRSGKIGTWTLVESAHLPDTFEFLHTITPVEKTFGTYKDFSDLPIPIEPYLRLMGWYLSDGCLHFSEDRLRSVSISQKKGGRLYGSMVKFSRKYTQLGTALYHYERPPNKKNPNTIIEARLVVADKTIRERILSDCGRAKDKRIPRWVFGLSKRLKQILFDAMTLGDGTVRNTSKKSVIYYSTLKGLANDVNELAVLCGWETSLWGPYPQDGCFMYQTHVYKEASQTRTLIRSHNVKKIPVTNQRIVCFTVPNQTLVVRRNGRISFQGNSKHAMHLVRLLRMCEEILTTGQVIVKRPDAEELRGIMQGSMSYEEILEWAETQDQKMNELYRTSTLPHQPNRRKLDEICQAITEAFL